MWPSRDVRAGGLLVCVMVAGALGLWGVSWAKEGAEVQKTPQTAAPLPVEGEMPSLGGATLWLQSQPLTGASLEGKVVLVEFWTYTCVNWLRQLPYVRAWAEKYKDSGLVVIGVHTPEFEFEKDVDNIRRAAGAMKVQWPIAVDSDRVIWDAFQNEYWPALYFIDAHGRIRHHHFGEGDYQHSEAVLQQLLAEAGKVGVPRDLVVSVDARGLEVAADWDNLRSPETYVRTVRIERFASPGGAVPEQRHTYAAPARLALNDWALAGAWTLRKDAGLLNQAGGRIVYRFRARDVNLIMGPAARGAPVRFRVLVDGRPPGRAHGGDVDDQGHGTVTDQRTYQLIRQPAPITERQFEIEFLDPGVEAFAFTFG